MDTACSVRRVRESDYTGIISVVDAWWGGRSMAPMLPRLFFKHFTQTSLVAESDGRIVGFLIGFLSQAHADEAYIHFAGVDPEYREKGVARALYAEFLSLAAAAGRTTAKLVTSTVNGASIAFHTHMDFEIVAGPSSLGEISYHPDYDGPGEDRVLFARRL